MGSGSVQRAETGQGSSKAGTPSSQPHSWLRRISTMSNSRDSSLAPQSRAGSSATSHCNDSTEFLHAGSDTPALSSSRTPMHSRNKLVKRSSSVRSSSSSSFQGSGSRLPMPTFKRPTTSHSRSVTWQHSLEREGQVNRLSLDPSALARQDQQWEHYFIPKVPADRLTHARRRHSTGIPNPIKRIYPDRKYTPVLVSGQGILGPLRTEVDDSLSLQEPVNIEASTVMAVASSPLASKPAKPGELAGSGRALSIGDLLSAGPQQLWKRPSSSRGRLPAPKVRKNVRGSPLESPAAMGNTWSGASERPTKRRNVADSDTPHRSIYSINTTAFDPKSGEIHLDLASTAAAVGGTPHSDPLGASQSPRTERPRLDSDHTTASGRPPRLSVAQSEIPSTVGSDSDQRSVGDESTDYQSDTVYDSYPTRTTRSSSGRRGPPIDAIFDDSPSNFSGRSTKLADLLSDASVPGSDHGARFRHSTIEEEGSVVSTPVRSMRSYKEGNGTPSTVGRGGSRGLFGSSPPAMVTLPDPDDIDWDAPEEQETSGSGNEARQSTLNPFASNHPLPLRPSPFTRSQHSSSAMSTPNRNGPSLGEKASIFDWSEEQPSPGHNNQSPPRPKTVHGKKDPETRGSRAAGRRPPSGMHARSHSVPVVPDMDGKKNNVVANKFGTWGVGSKGVTEDWNEDFDFDLAPAPVPTHMQTDEKRVDSGHEMFVPKSIRDQQENVVANIGLLREWGLLIEELKELRIRAVALDMISGPHAVAWQEVDAMIELADQETEEKTLDPQRSRPSSPGFDDVFDEPAAPTANISRIRRPSAATEVKPSVTSEGEATEAVEMRHQSSTAFAPSPRPRRDSEAVARSVIAALQTKRSGTSLRDPTSKKVPFDTATLRHIVPYVNGLKRKVKDALRETEGLYSSPRRPNHGQRTHANSLSEEEPAFQAIFKGPQPGSPSAQRHGRRSRAITDNDGSERGHMGRTNSAEDLAASLQAMSFSPPRELSPGRAA